MAIRALLLALLPALLVSTRVAIPSPGQLCMASSPCVAVPAGEQAVTPVPEPRTFSWSSASGDRVILGVIPAGADHLRTELRGVGRLRLSSGEPARWPAASTLTVRQGALLWQIRLSSAQVKAGVELCLAPGAYEFTAASPRHRPTTHAFTIAAAPVEVAITLVPLPQLTGRVIAKTTREPVPGAAITLPAGEVVAIADGTGRFAFDADPEHWPETIAIAAGGFGMVTVPVPRARAGADLLDIALSTGATLRVTIQRDPGIRDVTVDLVRRRYDMPDPAPIATRNVGREESAVTFEHVEEGTYVLIARGTEPTQRFGMKLTVGGEDRALTLPLRPVHLVLTTLLGETPLAGAKVRLSSTDGLWQEELRTGASGTVDLTLWQLGKLTALVSAEPVLTVPYLDQRSFGEDAEAEWTIHVSPREVRGVVVNAATGEPVPNANVVLEVKERYSALARADGDGRFVFTSAVPGEHAVSAAADGYQHDTVAYTFLESEQTHRVTVRLATAASARVMVRDAAGSPLTGAAVLDFAGFTLMGERFSDDRGEVAVPMRSGETRDVYVIPRDGSFAIGKISKAESLIAMPAPQATIVVTARSTNDEPIPGVWVVLRYNGIPLPFEVQQALARQQGATTVSGADGRIVLRHMPLGTYELWPVGSAGEARAAMTGLGEDAPVRIAARPGLNEALLQFSPK